MLDMLFGVEGLLNEVGKLFSVPIQCTKQGGFSVGTRRTTALALPVAIVPNK